MERYKDSNGIILGAGSDMPQGGSIATQQEIIEHEASVQIGIKWYEINKARSKLTVTTASGNVYNASKEGIYDIMHKEMTLMGDATCVWYEDWGSFTTNKVELQEALRLANTAYQNLLDTILGA